MFLPGRDKRVLLQESATIEPQGFRIKLDSRLDEKLRLQAAQKDSEARRAKNRRAEAYLTSTLERGD